MSVSATGRFNAVETLLDHNLAAGRGNKLAYVDPAESLTYAQLHERTCRFANALGRLGIQREARIALILNDTVDFPVVFLGAIRAGIVPVALNTLLNGDQYAYMLADSRAQVLVISQTLLPVVAPHLAQLPDLRHVVISGSEAGSHHLLSALLAAESPKAETAPTHADEPCFWLYSSGSTGAPKGTKHVHSSMIATAETFGKQVLGIREDDVVHSAAKLFFAYGLGNALSFPLAVGATVILNPGRPTPQAVFDLFKAHQPTIFCGVPTLFASMLGDVSLSGEKGSPRLRICTSAGEALPEHVGLAWKARFGSDILDGVGSTEMLHIFLANQPGNIRYGCSGRPVPGYDVRLVNEANAEVSGDEVGELLVRGPSAAEGYWNQRDKSRRTFEGEWTRTGDKYTRDADGYYTFCGRADDMFKVSGMWVSPFEVESALITHAAVLEAAVVPGTDDDGLLRPYAFVILKEGQSAGGLQEALKDHVKAKIGLWKYPRWVQIVDTLPKTATGKIQRFKLRDLIADDDRKGG